MEEIQIEPQNPEPKKTWLDADTQSTLRILVAGTIMLAALGYITQYYHDYDIACANYYSGISSNMSNQSALGSQLANSIYTQNVTNEQCYQGRNSNIVGTLGETSAICYTLSIIFIVIAVGYAINARNKMKG